MGSTLHEKVSLVALDGDCEIVVGWTPVVIGRDPRCDVRLGSDRVSRHHCCVSVVEGGVVVRDLGSTNGLRINGQRVTWGHLRPGVRLSIAHVDFCLEVDSTQEVRVSKTPYRADEPRGSRAGR